MVLILGALGAGKRAYAGSLGYADEQMSADPFSDAPVQTDLERLLKNDPACADAIFEILLKKELVLCREVGSGVIPMNEEDRAWREATGRLCCALAARASAVVRVVAGIPVALKGDLPCVCD